MKIAILGLKHLGSVYAAGLAEADFDVLAIGERDDEVLEREPGLSALFHKGEMAGRLQMANAASIAYADVLWICHDVPLDEVDRGCVSYVVDEIRHAASLIRDDAIILSSAQLPIGTLGKLAQETGRTFACSPENLRRGMALKCFRDPKRIVIGVNDQRARDVIEPIMVRLCDNLIWMTVEQAEMAKHALNCFLATSITLANEIGSLCDAMGIDPSGVEQALRSDPRIGPNAYVKPGPAFTGGTLARDVNYLQELARVSHVEIPLISNVLLSNRLRASRAA